MDPETFMEECLRTHEDLLALERRVHDWICGLAGIEVVADAREPLPWQKPGWNEPPARAALPAPVDRPAEPLDAPDTAAPAAGLGGPLDFAAEAGLREPTDEPPAWEQGAQAQRMARENRPPRPGREERAEASRRAVSDNPWAE